MQYLLNPTLRPLCNIYISLAPLCGEVPPVFFFSIQPNLLIGKGYNQVLTSPHSPLFDQYCEHCSDEPAAHSCAGTSYHSHPGSREHYDLVTGGS